MPNTQQPTNKNVCDTTKQITTTYFNTLPDQQKIQYITDQYKMVSKITPTAPVQHYKHYSPDDNDELYFTDPEQFKTAIKNNPVILDHIVYNHMDNISFTLDQLVIPKSSRVGVGRNTEKYPIPSTESEKMFVKLNPDYCCNGLKKGGVKCVWLNVKNGFCAKCDKQPQNIPIDKGQEIADQAKPQFKTFKSNFNNFVINYYVNNVFSQDLYDKDQQPLTNTPPTSPDPTPPSSPKEKPKKTAKVKKTTKK